MTTSPPTAVPVPPDTDTGDRPSDAGLRTRIADAMIETVRTGDTLTPDSAAVAAAAGIPLELIEEQFPTWESLVAVAIVRWHESRTMPLLGVAATGGAVAFLREVVMANAADPRLMRLLIGTLAVASERENPASQFYRHQYDTFYETIRQLLVRDIAEGREPATMDPSRGAEQLLALYEGLQLQSMLRDSINVVEAFARAATRLRRGWSETYHPDHTTDTFSGIYDI